MYVQEKSESDTKWTTKNDPRVTSIGSTLRKLSLDEHFRLMGFKLNKTKREIKFPKHQNYTKLGRRAGNGWDINLVSKLLNNIFKQIP
jgi:hypothetical protein